MSHDKKKSIIMFRNSKISKSSSVHGFWLPKFFIQVQIQYLSCTHPIISTLLTISKFSEFQDAREQAYSSRLNEFHKSVQIDNYYQMTSRF